MWQTNFGKTLKLSDLVVTRFQAINQQTARANPGFM